MSFKYVLIPCDRTANIIVKEGSTAGGLNDDFLVKSAKEYFSNQSSASETNALIDNASPSERKALAEKIRQTTPNCEKIDDDLLIQMFRTSQNQSSCEIHALVVPKATNNNIGVSMYSSSSDHSNGIPLSINSRAMELLQACGHTVPPSGIRGDVFVGRYHDDEIRDIWERVDFLETDVDPNSDWCQLARIKGGGGGSGTQNSTSPSLSGMMTNALSQSSSSSSSTSQQAHDMLNGIHNDHMEQELENVSGCKWSQTREEVELKFYVAPGTKAKYVKVTFGKTSLKVVVAGQTLISGETGGEVAVDDSTYTLQDGGNDMNDGKELAITLAKKREGISWSYPVQVK